jgi:hypothetical protein
MPKTRIHKLKPRVSVTAETSPYVIPDYTRKFVVVKMERDTVNRSWTVTAWDISRSRYLSERHFMPYRDALAQFQALTAIYFLDNEGGSNAVPA